MNAKLEARLPTTIAMEYYDYVFVSFHGKFESLTGLVSAETTVEPYFRLLDKDVLISVKQIHGTAEQCLDFHLKERRPPGAFPMPHSVLRLLLRFFFKPSLRCHLLNILLSVVSCLVLWLR